MARFHMKGRFEREPEPEPLVRPAQKRKICFGAAGIAAIVFFAFLVEEVRAPPLPEPWGRIGPNNTSFNNTTGAELILGNLDNSAFAVIGSGLPYFAGAVIMLFMLFAAWVSRAGADLSAVIFFPLTLALSYYGFIPEWLYFMPAILGGYIVASGILRYFGV